MPKSNEVDAWFARYDNPMKPVVERIREIVLGADGRIDECIKWQAPTFVYQGNLASFFPRSKQHASLMFHTGAQIPGRHPLLTGGGDTSRVMKIATVADANAAKRDIARIVRAWCDWRDGSVKGGATAKVRAGRTASAAKPSASTSRRASPNGKAPPAKANRKKAKSTTKPKRA